MHIYLGFAALAGLLLWAVIYARGPWALKLALILTVPAYGILVWHSLEQWRGYPVPRNPSQGVLVAARIEEPRLIYLWLIPSGKSEPRAYRIPYSRQLHEQIVRGQQMVQAGGGNVQIRYHAGRYRAYRLPPGAPPKED